MDECPPPELLVLDWRCRKYNALPDVGGLKDQHAGDMERMAAASNVYDAVANWRAMFYGGGDVAGWQRRNRDVWKVVQAWMKVAEWL